MSQQTALFLTTVAAGAVMGFVYDIFRILRKIVPHINLIVQLEDIIYWLAVTLTMFYFMLHQNYGEIRFFTVAGALLGAVLYFCTLSILIIKVSVTVIQFAQKVAVAAARILLTPVRLLIKLITPPGKWMLKKTRAAGRFAHKYTRTKLRGARTQLKVIIKKV